MGLALVVESETPSPDISAYVSIDKRVDGAEEDALLARWEFGRMLLAERDAHGGKQLPHGRVNELASVTGKSRSELRYRAQFAEQYPTMEKVTNALVTFGSWHEIAKKGLVSKPKAVELSQPISDDDLWRVVENVLIEAEAAITEMKVRRLVAAPVLREWLVASAVTIRDAKKLR